MVRNAKTETNTRLVQVVHARKRYKDPGWQRIDGVREREPDIRRQPFGLSVVLMGHTPGDKGLDELGRSVQNRYHSSCRRWGAFQGEDKELVRWNNERKLPNSKGGGSQTVCHLPETEIADDRWRDDAHDANVQRQDWQ